MKSAASTVSDYLNEIPENRKAIMHQLRDVIANNLPKGFEEGMSYGMIAYVVPLTVYPAGYHCNPQQPLPFLNLACQKNFVAVYHMGLFADNNLMSWFLNEYLMVNNTKLDMGKSCIRFKNIDTIPLELIGNLAAKLSVEQWIKLYERSIKNNHNCKL